MKLMRLFQPSRKISRKKMYDFLEDYTNSEYFEKDKGIKVLASMVA